MENQNGELMKNTEGEEEEKGGKKKKGQTFPFLSFHLVLTVFLRFLSASFLFPPAPGAVVVFIPFLNLLSWGVIVLISPDTLSSYGHQSLEKPALRRGVLGHP